MLPKKKKQFIPTDKLYFNLQTNITSFVYVTFKRLWACLHKLVMILEAINLTKIINSCETICLLC